MNKNVSQKETVDLLNKCWMTHDGMWFYYCLKEFGIETANKINKRAIKSLSSIETQRIKVAIGFEKEVESYEDFKHFFQEASKLTIPDFMNLTLNFSQKNNKLLWDIKENNCFAYKGMKRLGAIDKYECGVLYRIKCWMQALGIIHNFNPEVDNCLMHHTGQCSGDIQLLF